jgi:galactokinase
MDQSASVFSERGSALYVSFKPELKAKPVGFPKADPEFVFLIAQSYVEADKHVTGPVNYNLRVVECTLAAEFLAKKLGINKPLPKDPGPLGVSLRGLLDTYFEEKSGVEDNTQIPTEEFAKQIQEMYDLTNKLLTEESGYTREEIGAVIGISVDEVNKRYTSTFPVRADKFLLRQRALHVFGEAGRVLRYMALLSQPSLSSANLPSSLGVVMNESQASCRSLYNCSCPELDELCEIALGAGALGSRLTGAGFGGSSVHLVPKEKVEAVKAAWEKDYYRKRFPDISEEKLEAAVVLSTPGSGSYVFKVSEV